MGAALHRCKSHLLMNWLRTSLGSKVGMKGYNISAEGTLRP
jgi:hypothetical protein